jgi:uncharacterized protein YjbI with pentapeptide repeats
MWSMLTEVQVAEHQLWLESNGLAGRRLAKSYVVVECGERLVGADLSHSVLHFGDMRRVQARGARFIKADLRHAELSSAILEGADMTGANLELVDAAYAHLANATLCGASLRDTTLRSVDARRADFRGAAMFEATLSDADLEASDLRGADMRAALLEGVNTKRVRSNWVTRMTARDARCLSAEQKRDLGMGPRPR